MRYVLAALRFCLVSPAGDLPRWVARLEAWAVSRALRRAGVPRANPFERYLQRTLRPGPSEVPVDPSVFLRRASALAGGDPGVHDVVNRAPCVNIDHVIRFGPSRVSSIVGPSLVYVPTNRIDYDRATPEGSAVSWTVGVDEASGPDRSVCVRIAIEPVFGRTRLWSTGAVEDIRLQIVVLKQKAIADYVRDLYAEIETTVGIPGWLFATFQS